MFVDVVGNITASDQPETVMCRGLAEALGELWRTFGNAFDTYRPELYYMRGPGPKWRAKHPGHRHRGPRSALTHSMQLRTF
jgi:hypothetical protein